MPKAKAKKSSTDKKTKKDSSVKLSKALSKFTPLKDMMNSDLGRELLADALIAAAGAAAAALTKSRTVKKAGSATAEAGTLAAGATRDAVQTAAGAVAGVVTETARHFLPAALLAEEPSTARTSHRSSSESERKPRYAHRASDHSKRKTSRKVTKSEKGSASDKSDKAGKSA
ncbi:hypothetical protein [Microvirga puerhi]|uniref:Uncharacterized protein n=1 Tax=Microvirga puerhi TaxID=2876078 RepID=A0ABS7VKR2_9HYPH|nr:hypothetical protein [Microvirga puerhi]MBZ6076123.1 hypothetical protein [Microvirga puerhi]